MLTINNFYRFRGEPIFYLLCLWFFSIHALAVTYRVPDVYLLTPQPQTSPTNKPADVLITAKTIQQAATPNIGHLLQGKAGIQLINTSSNSQRPSISLLGFGENAAENSLVLLNDQPLANQDLQAVNLSVLNPEEFTAIEIIPGSQSILYGDQAVGGIVNFKTRPITGTHAVANVRAGTLHHREQSVRVEKHWKNGSFAQLFGRNLQTAQYREHNQLSQSDLHAQGGIDSANDSLHFSMFLSQSHTQLPGALTLAQLKQNRRQASPYSSKDHVDQDWAYLSAVWRHALTDHWGSTLTLTSRKTSDTGFLGLNFATRRHIQDVAAQFTGPIHVGQTTIHNIAGLDLSNDNYQYQALTLPIIDLNDAQWNESIYSQFQIPFSTGFSTIIGWREAFNTETLNHETLHRAKLVSSQALLYQSILDWQIKLTRSGNYRFPKADEQHNVFVSNTVSPLKTQTGENWQLDFSWQHNPLYAQLSLFRLDLENEIAFAPLTPGSPRADNRNLAPTRRDGSIWTLGVRPWSFWEISANALFVSARFRSGPFSGKKIPFVANTVLRLDNVFNLNEHWQIITETIYVGPRFAAEDDTNQSSVLGGTTIHNAVLRYQLQKFGADLRIDNLNNKKYFSYVLMPMTDLLYYYPAPERSYLVTLHYDFA